MRIERRSPKSRVGGSSPSCLTTDWSVGTPRRWKSFQDVKLSELKPGAIIKFSAGNCVITKIERDFITFKECDDRCLPLTHCFTLDRLRNVSVMVQVSRCSAAW